MLEKIRNTAPPITPAKIGTVWTFDEVLLVLDSVPEPDVEWGGEESEAFFLWGASFGTGGFAEPDGEAEGEEGLSRGGAATRLNW